MVTCNQCSGKSYAFDNFCDVSLSFEQKLNRTTTNMSFLNNSQSDPDKVEDMFEDFLSEEFLDEDYCCQKCGAKGTCTKRLILQKFPKILVLQLKRF